MMLDRAIRTGPLATSVAPNPKCEGCLHYVSQAGPMGVCEIGEKPFKCGDGSDPITGYAPVVSTGPGLINDNTPAGQAYAGPSPNAGAERMPIVCLGEEHAEMVKSIEAKLVKSEEQFCPLHSQHAQSFGQVGYDSGAHNVRCSCAHITDRQVTKGFMKSLTNRERAFIGDAEASEFVSEVRKSRCVPKAQG